jgi:SAM-dependent methyltransferase
MKLVERPCPGCGGTQTRGRAIEPRFDLAQLDEFAYSSRKMPEFMRFRLVECDACELLYASPVPEEGFVEAAYHEAGFETGVESGYAARTYAAQLPRILAQLPDRVGALDIGAGDGAFLAELQKAGFEKVRGVEPSRAALETAAPGLRECIRAGFFSRSDAEPESLSLVSCFQTLEHVRQPAELFASVHSLLKPGGAFLTIVHDRDGVLSRLLGTRSPIFDIEHLQLFCRTSLRNLYERSGFERVDVAPLTNRYPLSYWVRLLPAPVALKAAVTSALAGVGLAQLAVPLRAGNLVAVGYRAR